MAKEISKAESCSSCDSPSEPRPRNKHSAGLHTDHLHTKKRINRIKGQIEAVARMVDEKDYCPDIIQQIRAATSALRGLEAEILKGHLRGCVKIAFESKDAYAVNDKIDEILRLWSK